MTRVRLNLSLMCCCDFEAKLQFSHERAARAPIYIMCVDKLIPTDFASISRHHVGGACCRRQRSRHAETNTKKGIESGMLSFFNTLNFVGVTGLEPATSRPPDAYSNQLSYTPIVFWRITLEKQDFLCVCECKGSTFIRFLQIFRGFFSAKQLLQPKIWFPVGEK